MDDINNAVAVPFHESTDLVVNGDADCRIGQSQVFKEDNDILEVFCPHHNLKWCDVITVTIKISGICCTSDTVCKLEEGVAGINTFDIADQGNELLVVSI